MAKTKSGMVNISNRQRASAKLTPVQVRRIRNMYDSGRWTQLELAEKVQCHQVTISAIVNRKTWVNVR